MRQGDFILMVLYVMVVLLLKGIRCQQMLGDPCAEAGELAIGTTYRLHLEAHRQQLYHVFHEVI